MNDARKRFGLLPMLVILDHFKGQTTQKVLSLLKEYQCAWNRLQPLDVSVNHTAKHFMQTKFDGWYADRIIV